LLTKQHREPLAHSTAKDVFRECLEAVNASRVPSFTARDTYGDIHHTGFCITGVQGAETHPYTRPAIRATDIRDFTHSYLSFFAPRKNCEEYEKGEEQHRKFVQIEFNVNPIPSVYFQETSNTDGKIQGSAVKIISIYTREGFYEPRVYQGELLRFHPE